MAGIRFADLQARPMEFLDFTSVTLEEFQQLVPPFDAAFRSGFSSHPGAIAAGFLIQRKPGSTVMCCS